MIAPRLRLLRPPRPSRPLRVLYLIDSLGPGGAERLMVDLLPELRQIGIEGRVVAIQERHGNPVADELRAAGIEVDTIGIERLRERGALHRVTEVIAADAPDLVHTQLEFANILGSIAAHRLGIPGIATIHTLDRPGRLSRAGLRLRLMAWTLRRRSTRVVAVSESARLHVLARAGLPRRHTVTIHNGIDLEPFLTARPDAGRNLRAEVGIDPARPVVTTVAVLREPKGIQFMIAALPGILEQHPDAVYLVVGDGPHRASLEDLAARTGVADSTRFIGRSGDIPAVLAATDLFVLPSLTEALPTVVIEAMAAAIPVVATDVGGTREVLTGGGVVVPARSAPQLVDAVARLLGSPRQRHALGQEGRRLAVERFSVARHAARLADEYRVLALGGGRQ